MTAATLFTGFGGADLGLHDADLAFLATVRANAHRLADLQRPVPMPTPARTFDLTGHLRRQRDFSLRTFGPGGRVDGVCDHLMRETDEVDAKPHDPSEWADLLLLACDGAMRNGAEPEAFAADVAHAYASTPRRPFSAWIIPEIAGHVAFCRSFPYDAKRWLDLVLHIARGADGFAGLSWRKLWQAAADKLAVNERRTWPDWRTAGPGPIEHDRSADGDTSPAALDAAKTPP